MRSPKKHLQAYLSGNVRCARLIVQNPRTVPGSLVWRWATAVLSRPDEDPTGKTPGPLFEVANTQTGGEGV